MALTGDAHFYMSVAQRVLAFQTIGDVEKTEQTLLSLTA